MNFIYGHDENVAKWVVSHLRGFEDVGEFKPFSALGIEKDGKMIAGVIFNNFRRFDIQLTMAATSPRWATKKNINEILAYPFGQLKCKRVTATTAKPNKRLRKLVEGLGFKLEGVVRKGMDGEKDACVYGLLASDWTRSKYYGKIIP